MNTVLKTVLTLTAAALGLQAQAAPYLSIVPAKSSVTFSYKQMGVAMNGHFKKFTAQVNFDPAKAEQANASFEVDLASVDAGSSEADQEVQTKSWFNASVFPKAQFVAKQIKATGPNQYEVLGTLTLKGLTRDGLHALARAQARFGPGWVPFSLLAHLMMHGRRFGHVGLGAAEGDFTYDFG